MLVELPPTYESTRTALHAAAEHVLASARYQAEGRIGLRPTRGGIGTPAFGDREVLRVEIDQLVHERAGAVRRAPLTTLGAAAAFAGVPLGAPPVYTPLTPGDPDLPLTVDGAAARILAEWYAMGAAVLGDLVAEYPDAAELTLWPEHLDLATSFAAANYGASPGDDAIAEPYLYAGPWDEARRTGRFARRPWGDAVTYSELGAGPDPAAPPPPSSERPRRNWRPERDTWGMAQTFTRMDTSTAEQWAVIGRATAESQPRVAERTLELLRSLAEITDGFAVDQLTHCLQTATLAERAGADDELIFASLLHDIGKAVSVPNHPEIAAAIIKPYVRSDVYDAIRVHQDFQGRHYYAHFGGDPNAREPYRGEPWFDLAAQFADEWDQIAFDPDYDTLPLEHFEPLVRSIMKSGRIVSA